ncbi:MAG TPA: hypothetical protein VIV09_02760 [Pseudolabrys sp.]
MSISSIGIQTVTPSTGTRGQQQAQQQNASNDNTPPPAKPSSPSPTTGQHVDKRV